MHLHHLTSALCGLFLVFFSISCQQISTGEEQPPSSNADQVAVHLSHSGNTYCGVAPYPEPIELVQPDGSSFMAYLFTEGPAAYLETLDGYSVLQDRSDNFYRYATRGKKGDLYLTGVPVSALDNRSSTEITLLQVIRPHLRYEGIRLAELTATDQLRNYDDDEPGTSAVFPPAGVQKALLLLIDFPDQAFTYPQGDFDNMANQVGYNVNGNSGSFRDYYLDISYGLLTVNTDVEGWYTALNNKATYGIESLANRNFHNAVPLIREAVDAAEAAGIDFSQYDGDGDGRVDVVEVIHSGRGAEASGNVDDIWSHRWVLAAASLSVTYDGKLINDYIIQPEKHGANSITNIGVFVHEFGHALGLPDLYDTDNSSRGLGHWCCMAGGTWNNSGKTPAQFSAWCKKELGWISPTVLSGNGDISNMDYSDNDDEAYQFDTPDADEYFLLENRQKIGWDAHIPGEGLAIYHIDESRNSNSDESRPWVDLEQADGDRDLNLNVNSGDNGDLYPGSSNNTEFNCSTSPNSNNYSGGVSNINIFDISSSGDLINFSYDFCSTDCSVADIATDGSPSNIAGGTYDQAFTISYSFPPASGTLDVSAAGITVNEAITGSPQTVTITGLPADGESVTVSASFSEEPSCAFTANNLYNAPSTCDNDDVCDALDITANIDGAAVTCSNYGATTQNNEPRPNAAGCGVQNGWCENTLHNTVWFQFTAPASGSINIDFNTAIDMQMALWEANSCQELLNSSTRMMVAANDDSGSAGGYSPLIENQSCLIPGKTYFLQIDGWSGTTGNFSFTISDPGISCDSAPINSGDCGNVYTASSDGNGEWIHIVDGSGNRIASINDEFNNLGDISLEYNINTGAIRKDGDNYPILDRDWFIDVENNNAATVRLYLTEQELQDLITAGGPNDLDEIELLKVSGSTCGDYNNGTPQILAANYAMEDFSGSTHLLEYKVSGFSGFFPRSNAAILPIEMKYFRGTPMHKTNLLSWASSLEENTKLHEIERLLPGETTWEQIGNTPAAGDSQQEVKYEWSDVYPLPKAYYRIKTVDLDGSFQYSDIILLEREGINFQLTRVFPNPAKEQVTTEYYTDQSTVLQWQLVNTQGQVVAQNSVSLTSGRNFVAIELGSYPAGIYFLRSKNGPDQRVTKIVKE
ncbi:MAG: M6 family metalloprotease domain-containing protein [Lewinella sp.]|uniref:M6 family metalloprotease domain-containing protein n=1 Tax=Lewinella sp. TaxID=2004506 RepID=UPI003D6BF763